MGKIKRLLVRLNKFRPYGFWAGFSAGVLYFGYIFFWLWNLYPLTGFGLSNGLISFLIIFIIFSIAVVGMAVFWGLFSYFSFKFFKDNPWPIFAPFYLAGTFILAEYLRSFFFGILLYGNGSYLGPHWTIGNLAYFFSGLGPVLKTSSLWGIYGIEFLVIYITSGIIFYSQKRDTKKLIFPLTALAVTFLAGFLPQFKQSHDTETLPVALIQTRIPSKVFYAPEESLVDFKLKLELIKKAGIYLDSFKNGGLIVLPEGAGFLNNLNTFLNPDAIRSYFEKLSVNELLIVDQFRLTEGEGLKSKTAILSSKQGLIAVYNKRLLTPTGEYIPYILKLPLFIASRLGRFEMPTDFYSSSNSNVFQYQGKNIKIVVCSELLSPSIVAEENSDLIVAIHNFGLFNGGRLLEKQILAMSRFRAVESHKYSITSSNYGQSYVIDSDGNVEKRALTTDYELLTAEIVPNQSQTWYNYVGDLPILLLSSVFFAVGTKKIRNEFTG